MKYVVTQDESGKEEIFIFPKNINLNLDSRGRLDEMLIE